MPTTTTARPRPPVRARSRSAAVDACGRNGHVDSPTRGGDGVWRLTCTRCPRVRQLPLTRLELDTLGVAR